MGVEIDDDLCVDQMYGFQFGYVFYEYCVDVIVYECCDFEFVFVWFVCE